MLANYGYKDGSGDFFITVDTDKCDGCGECVTACPSAVLELAEDPHDPFREEPVVIVGEAERKKIKYTCAPCKPTRDRPPLPCASACPKEAISHSW
jgi:NAD-dependent dihydropyrimidine dehydrogenase PreA subunit